MDDTAKKGRWSHLSFEEIYPLDLKKLWMKGNMDDGGWCWPLEKKWKEDEGVVVVFVTFFNILVKIIEEEDVFVLLIC